MPTLETPNSGTRTPYNRPELVRWGTLRDITNGPGTGTTADGKGKNAPLTKGIT